MAMRRSAVLIVIVVGVLVQCGCQRSTDEPTSPVAVDKWTSFASPYFGFPYPANWKTLDGDEIQRQMEKGLAPYLEVDGGDILWAGGVSGCPGSGRCSSSNTATIFAMVVRVPGYPGPMSDQDYSLLADMIESTGRQSLGTRLRAVDRLSVSSFRAIASTILAPNGGAVLRQMAIYAKANHMYVVYCYANQRSFDSYAEVFENAIRQMEVKTG